MNRQLYTPTGYDYVVGWAANHGHGKPRLFVSSRQAHRNPWGREASKMFTNPSAVELTNTPDLALRPCWFQPKDQVHYMGETVRVEALGTGSDGVLHVRVKPTFGEEKLVPLHEAEVTFQFIDRCGPDY